VKYAVEMGSGAMHTKVHEDYVRHLKVDGGGYTDSKVIP
jgi:hypothetical protein